MLGRLRSPDARAADAIEASREASPAGSRRSPGLKDFLWLMPEQPEGRLLDLGPVAQATVTFFTDRGFRVSTEDLIRGWTEWEAEREAERKSNASSQTPDPSLLAADFLAANLCFEPETFHGILAWDVFDFLPAELLDPLASRLHGLLTPGGVLLSVFHDSAEIDPTHYRIRDTESVELIPARRPQKVGRVFQNREILSLFSGFRSSRTYVGRDHLREALFLK
ncbi:MAG TPA: class I SAM-dependent methyltransferase [Candidatus Dormibacteraeota bacterium]|nr:class I SAM-dependent methyltransferase [Candidatus Dormibacteraeota bacterium]